MDFAVGGQRRGSDTSWLSIVGRRVANLDTALLKAQKRLTRIVSGPWVLLRMKYAAQNFDVVRYAQAKEVITCWRNQSSRISTPKVVF